MKNSNLGRKIKDLRSSQGLSQNQLAIQTRLSLRTIQRIENGETDPRGETLNLLATVLNSTTLELFNWTEHEDKSYLVLINLSALSFLLFPVLGILVPLAIWVFKRDKIKYMNETGKTLLNFQITWCALTSLFYVCWMVGKILHIEGGQWLLLALFLLYGFNFTFIISNIIRSSKSKKVFYQPSIPFLR